MLNVGTVLIDRYRITDYIHKGGMGAVYRAHDQLDNIVVAVKQSFHAETDFLREQFRREAMLLRRLNHPALPKVHNYFAEGSGQFLVMDCIEGDDLEMRLKRNGRPFPPEQVCEWADALLDALNYIHTHQPPVFHRDIKPANLKLSPESQIKLLDFGLAKNSTTPTLPGGSVHGYTLVFSSPEQCKGTRTDARSDIYSIGATLYRLLTHQEPVNSQVREEVINNGVRDPLKAAHALNPAAPLPLSGLIQRAMALDPAQRFQSAMEMRIALQQALSRDEENEPAQSAIPKLGENKRFSGREAAEAAIKPREPFKPGIAVVLSPRDPFLSSSPVPGDGDLTVPRDKGRKTLLPVRSWRPLAISAAAVLVLLVAFSYWMLNDQSVPVLSYSLNYDFEDKSGSKFRFEFKARQNGFLYIVAPNAENKLITFLTTSPHPNTRVSTNEVLADRDYHFFGGGQWIKMRANPASFTLIFATNKLTQPGFLNADAGRELRKDALDELRRQSQARKPKLTNNGDGATIKALEATDKPIVVDIQVPWRVREG